MKKILLATASVLALTSAASAQGFNGAYLGASLGLSGHNSSADLFDVWDDEGYSSYAIPKADISTIGAGLGAYAGWNWQSGMGVFGIETDISGHTNRGTESFYHVDSYEEGTVKSELDWLWTLRARAGYLATPETLLYVTGGLAGADVTNAYSVQAKGINMKRNGWLWGWVLGAGIEHLLGDSISIRGEVLYVDLENSSANDDLGYFSPDVDVQFRNQNVVVGRFGAAIHF